jgi:hypothetical protein
MSDGPYALQDANLFKHGLSEAGNFSQMYGYTLIKIYNHTDADPAGLQGTKTSSTEKVEVNLELPLPTDLKDSFSAKWSASNYNSIIDNVVNEGRAKYEQGNGMLSILGSSLKAGFETAKSKITDTLVSSIVSAVPGVTETDVKIGLQRLGNAAVNNNESLYFEGHTIESFQITFAVVPLNASYYNNVVNNLKIIQQYATANLEENNTYWTIPHSFGIEVFAPANQPANQEGGSGKNPIKFYTREPFKIKNMITDFNISGMPTFHQGGELTKFSVQFDCIDIAPITRKKKQSFSYFGK